MVWHRWHIPRWSFIQWLALLGRLATKDRLRAWGLDNDTSCVLCQGGFESHSHLFFECSFTSIIWEVVKAKCGFVLPSRDLMDEIHWGLTHCKDCSIQSRLFKLCLAASVYYIWKERNGRIFQQIGYESTSVVRLILEEVKASMTSWRHVSRSATNICLILKWGLNVDLLCTV
ncbi:hypothetical protein RHGRI_031740 [Rhododendron griersonianum]|uniref:Reverse transcriptase zinc-binding domain-containing protein n=2 Tax=Rhododendron griersonianum TaxID=479676 RepID=A0AAV6ICT9_9ERIC|nr:hypothetical protein RHGRI_031740 [Rhododendron griersonianum]